MRVLLILLILVALAACGQKPASAPSASPPTPAAQPPAPPSPVDPASEAGAVDRPGADAPPQAIALGVGLADKVDYRCRVDTDCAVKNVGNCCGYFPACVNKDSPTFPEAVQADCIARGESSICGFVEISACRCEAGRCVAADTLVR